MIQFTKEYTTKTENLHLQIEEYRYTDTAKEYKFADKLYTLALEHDDFANIAYSLLRKSDDLITQEKFSLAFTYISDAKTIATDHKIYKLLIKSYISFANMYNCLGDIHKTMASVLESYKIVKHHPEKYPEAYLLNKIGNLFLLHGYYTKASSFFKIALKEIELPVETEYKKRKHISFLYSNLFFTLFYLQHFDKAISYHTKRKNYLQNKNSLGNLYYEFEEAYIYNHFNKKVKLHQQVVSILASIKPSCFYIYNTLETIKHFFTILYFTNDKYLIWQGIQKMNSVLSEQTPLPIKIYLTQNTIKYYTKFESENNIALLHAYEKLEQLREKRDKQIEKFNCHEMEIQIQAAENALQYEQTLKEKEMYQAMYNQDSITGLLNRRGLNEAFIEMAKKRTNTSTIGVIIFDIDCFKQFNDNYGHIKGDTAIMALGDALHKNVDKGFVPARFGGDEFVCLVDNKTEKDIQEYIAAVQNDLATKKISHAFSTADVPYVTASIGFCNNPFTDVITLEKLIYKSDIALYQAKKAGKNRAFQAREQ